MADYHSRANIAAEWRGQLLLKSCTGLGGIARGMPW